MILISIPKNCLKFAKNAKIANNLIKFPILQGLLNLIFAIILANFDKTIEIAELCKGVHCVDLGESFQTHIFLQKLDSIQPRTSPVKFARSSNAARPRPVERRGAEFSNRFFAKILSFERCTSVHIL